MQTASTTRAPLATATVHDPALTILDYGGLKGLTPSVHVDGGTYDYSEDVTIDFDRYGRHDVVRRQRHGVAGRAVVALHDELRQARAAYGAQSAGRYLHAHLSRRIARHRRYGARKRRELSLHHAGTIVLPSRTHSALGQPYRYGFLVHPSGDSIGGPNATRIADLIAASGAGFVRIDYAGSQMMPAPGTFNFAPSDKIVALLAARKITLLPLLEQYSTAAWQSNGAPYPAIYASPALYAQYVGAVVAHLRTVAPHITRVELFNEPNLLSWWTSPTAAYAATDGSAAAAYMIAAYAAAKAANPAVTVVGPGLADGGGNTVDPRSFLTQMYASGCRTGVCWDMLSVHPYAWLDPTYVMPATASNRWQIYKDLQAIAVAHGDPVPHVMFTEWSYSTVNEADGFDPQVQALYLARGFNLSLRDDTLDGVVWTSLYNGGSDFWSRTAVTDASYHALPAMAAFRAYAVP